jgi:hypothetical protein
VRSSVTVGTATDEACANGQSVEEEKTEEIRAQPLVMFTESWTRAFLFLDCLFTSRLRPTIIKQFGDVI